MGDGRPHPFAISVLSAEARKRCEAGGLDGELGRTLQNLLTQVNSELDPHERLQFLAVVDGPWDIDSGLITPTMKLKRNVLEERYAPRVDGWIAAQKPVLWARGL
jgi:long-chain acyl-CoA synthetase